MTDSVVLVTGSSRGIGAETARRVAARDDVAAVVVHHRDAEKAWMAQSVARSIEERGVECLSVRADITDASEIERMFDKIRTRFGRLDRVVLNASGGLERDRVGTDYAMHVNRDAPVHIVNAALPLAAGRCRFVFVTSHWAHFGCADLGMYSPVARSKWAGEQRLLETMGGLHDQGVEFVVVSGDVVADSTTALLLDRWNPGWIAARRAKVGDLPDTATFADTIVQAAFEKELERVGTVYVGSTVM